MIYDDQPQMVEAVGARIGTANAPHVLREAFAAIDRKALIVTVAKSIAASHHAMYAESTRAATFDWKSYEQWAEAALVAAGIIPERER